MVDPSIILQFSFKRQIRGHCRLQALSLSLLNNVSLTLSLRLQVVIEIVGYIVHVRLKLEVTQIELCVFVVFILSTR